MKEVWKPVPYKPFDAKYSVSNLGRVKPNVVSRYSKNKAEYLKPVPASRGYLFVSLYAEGRAKEAFIHRMVTIAFHGPPPSPRAYALHKDDCQTNNTADNLYWGTEADNHLDRRRNGKDLIGARNGLAKLSEDNVREIRALYAQGGITQRALAARYGIAESNVNSIVYRRTWRHIHP